MSPYLKYLFLLTLFVAVNSENILIYMGYGHYSHKSGLTSLADNMAFRGHKVTFITSIPGRSTGEFKEISPRRMSDVIMKTLYESSVFEHRLSNYIMPESLWPLSIAETMCEAFLNSPEVISIIHKRRKVDLLIIDAIGNECALGLAQLYNIPFIYFHSSSLAPWIATSLGLPSIVPYKSHYTIKKLTDVTSFYNRINSMIAEALFNIYRDKWVFPNVQDLWEKKFGRKFTSFKETEKSVSVVFVNSHYTVDVPHPTLPMVVELAGINLRESYIIDQHILDFIKGSGNHGFIYVSFGTVSQSNTLPPEYINIFLQVFRKLRQKVLWKYEGNVKDLKNLPNNVLPLMWFPQVALLANEGCKAVISTPGRLTFLESVYFGVPILSIPLFGDQDNHAYVIEKNEIGVKLEFEDITTNSLYTAIKEVLHPKYRKNMESKSVQLRNHPSQPIPTAIYWTEWVLKHYNSTRLTPEDRSWPQYSYQMFDCFLWAQFTIVTSLYFIYRYFSR